MTKSQGILRKYAKSLAEEIGRTLNTANVSYTVCGSLRRGISIHVAELEIVVSDLLTAWNTIHALGNWHGVPLKHSNKGRRAVVEELFTIPVRLCHAYPEEWGATTLDMIGNHFFVIQLRSEAKSQGMKLNQYGLWHNENIIAGKTEEQIFDALGIVFVPPEHRELGPRQKLSELIIRRM